MNTLLYYSDKNAFVENQASLRKRRKYTQKIYIFTTDLLQK